MVRSISILCSCLYVGGEYSFCNIYSHVKNCVPKHKSEFYGLLWCQLYQSFQTTLLCSTSLASQSAALNLQQFSCVHEGTDSRSVTRHSFLQCPSHPSTVPPLAGCRALDSGLLSQPCFQVQPRQRSVVSVLTFLFLLTQIFQLKE